jgi:hypothetical protein
MAAAAAATTATKPLLHLPLPPLLPFIIIAAAAIASVLPLQVPVTHSLW